MEARIPSVAEFEAGTLSLMEKGFTNSDLMRRQLAKDHGLTLKTLRRQDPKIAHQFINNHAWALVRLQNEGQIEKLATKEYGLVEIPKPRSEIETPQIRKMPGWAKTLISGANARNRLRFPNHAELTEEDLIALWEECEGRCAITGLKFSNEKIGAGKAKRVFAPSVDRIDPAEGYSLENCRLVMVAVNFAMNSWGEETYLRLARAAIQHSKAADQ